MIKGKLDGRKRRLHVEVNEEVTSSYVSNLRAGLLKIIEEHPETEWDALYLDLRNCRMIDSMGVNWLFAESQRLKQMKKKFVVRISSPAIHRVMQFAGLDQMVTLKYRRRKQTR